MSQENFQLKKMITECCQIKAEIIQKDEKENGNRALLNLGHTFGHAIESFGNYDGKIIHGEAVAIGICMAFKFSNMSGFCSKADAERVINIFKKSKLPTSLKEIKNFSINTPEMIEKFKYDKKTRNNKLTFILNNKIIIRGETSLQGSVEPLLIVNGSPVSTIDNISPDFVIYRQHSQELV